MIFLPDERLGSFVRRYFNFSAQNPALDLGTIGVAGYPFDLGFHLVYANGNQTGGDPNIIIHDIDTEKGQKVPAALIANVIEGKGPNIINRENVQRRIVVQANVSGRDLGAVVNEIQAKIKDKVHLSQGFFISYEGQFQSQQEATRLIGLLSIATLATMFLVLFSHFRSTMIVAQILLNIPLAFIGGLVLTWLMIGKVSIATLVGLITLAGIASRNTIMMISHYIHLMQHEGEKFDKQMIVRGSLERLVPVTMTAAVAGLALIPLVLAANQPGKEILYPVAVVILGGLISSTFLDMAVTPAVFYKFGRRAAEKYIAREEIDPLDAIEAEQIPPEDATSTKQRLPITQPS